MANHPSAAGVARELRVLAREGLIVRRLRGVLRRSGRPLTLLYAGPASQLEQCDAYFDDGAPPGPEECGGASAGAPGPPRDRHIAASVVASLRPDVVLTAHPVPVDLGEAISFWPFLDATLDVAGSLEAQIARVRSKAHRRRLRRASRESAWSWTADEAVAGLRDFYRQLHHPYLEARFGERVHHTPLEHLEERLRREGGRVLRVLRSGEPVCGALLFDTPAGLDYDRNGFRLDSLASPVLLAERTAALELAVFQAAQELRAPSIFLGFCRAYLDDGLFTHKRRLGCRFGPARATARMRLWVRPELRPALFAAVPLVAGPCEALDAHVGLSREAPSLPHAELRALLKNFSLPAVRRAIVWTDLSRDDPRRSAFTAALEATLRGRPVDVREA